MPIKDISAPNAAWGICGFCSALGAVYDRGVLKKEIDKAITKKQLQTRILAEIKTFLVMLQAEGKSEIIKEIENFTRTFGGKWAKFTITNYIQNINNFAKTGVLGSDPSIAMPPNAVVDYLQRMCDIKSPKCEWVSLAANNVIVGVGVKDTSSKWGGVLHWIYKQSGDTIYNWGDVASLNAYLKKAKHTVLCQIKLG